jgi:hypothetical protein
MSDDGQLALDFALSVFDEPDTLTKAEYLRERRAALDATWVRRHEVTLVDPPATVGGRPYQDVDVSGGRL